MTRDEALTILKRSRPELTERGVIHAAIFGSTARGEATEASDVDVMIELDPEVDFDVFSYVGLTNFIADQFPMHVDVSERARLRPYIKPSAEADAVFAF